MVHLPHDVTLLIAEYVEPSDLHSLASSHRYFLYDYLKQRYRRPVVVTDSLQDEKCRRLLESNIARISGPLVRDLVHRLELRSDDTQRHKKRSTLSSFLGTARLSITGNAASGSIDSMLLHALRSFTHLRALYITRLETPSDNNFCSPPPPYRTAWLHLLPHAWRTLAPRLEQLHVAGSTLLLETVFRLKPQLCKALSTLCIEVYPEDVSHRRQVAIPMGQFVMALSGQLVSLALLGDGSSSAPRILVGDEPSAAAQLETDFPPLRALRIDLDFELGSAWTSLSLLTCLIRHHGLLRSLSVRYHDTESGMRYGLGAQPLVDFMRLDVIKMTSLRRLDVDMDHLPYEYHAAWPTHVLKDQKQILDEIGLIEGLEELRFRPMIAWEPDSRTTTGVASMLNPASTFSGQSRIFGSLKNLYINVLYLRAQIFEDLAEGAPQLESMHLVFEEFWFPKLSLETRQNGRHSTPMQCASRLSSAYEPRPAALVFITEVKSLRHLPDMRLRNLRLSWTSASRWSNHRTLEDDITVALRLVIPSSPSGTGLVKFVDPLEDWEQNLWWVDSAGSTSELAMRV